MSTYSVTPRVRAVLRAGVPVAAAASMFFASGFLLAVLSLRFFQDNALMVLLVVVAGPLFAVLIFFRPVYGPAIIICTFLLGSTGVAAGFASIEVVQAAIFGVAGLAAVRLIAFSEARVPWSPPLVWAVALVFWSLVTLVFTTEASRSVNGVLQIVAGVLLAWLVVAACERPSDLRLLTGIFFAVAALAAVLTLGTGAEFASNAAADATTVSGRATGQLFEQPNQLGSYLSMALPIGIAVMLGSRSLVARVAAGAGMLFILLALALTLSRGAWIGATCALLYLIVRARQVRRAAVLVVPILALAVPFALIAPQDATQFEVVGARARALTTRSEYDGRDRIYGEALRQIALAPFTGHGPGTFPVVAARAESDARTVRPDHAHNLFLNTAAEMGIPGLALLGALIAHIALAARRTMERLYRFGDREQLLCLGLTAALVAFLVHSWFDYVLGNSINAAAVWAVVGMLLAASRLRDFSRPDRGSPPALAVRRWQG